MNKIAKRVLAIMVASTMCLSLTACGGGSGSGTGTANTAVTLPKDAKAGDFTRFQKRATMQLSIASWNVGDAITTSTDLVRDKIYKKLNITIKPYQMTWGDYQQKISVWAASKNLPDMTCSDTAFTPSFDKWIDGKVVAQVPSDLSAYPDLNKTLLVNKEQAESYKAKDGHYYGIPKVQTPNSETGIMNDEMIMRKDWAAKVGITKSPTTVDEFISDVKKIQASDPDGNGKNDTVGVTAYFFPTVTSTLYGADPACVNGYQWTWKDGKLVHAYNDDHFINVAKDLNKMYKAGIIDPDLPSLKGEEGRDKFKNGKAVVYGHSNSASGFQAMDTPTLTQGRKLSDVLMNVFPFQNESDGKYYYKPSAVYWSETYFKYGMTAEKMDTCLSLLNYILSDEGHSLLAYGIEGTDYTKDASGKITMKLDPATGAIPDLSKKYPIDKIGNLAFWSGYFEDTNSAITADIKKLVNDNYVWAKEVNAQPYDLPNLSALTYPSKAKDTATAQNYQADLLSLMKTDNVEAEVAKIRAKYKKAGNDTIESELNAAAKKAGITQKTK